MRESPVRAVEKVWGGRRLAERFGLAAAGPIGEVHVHRPDEDGPPPVLLKWLETTAPLSVQCHPREGRTKDEVWWFLKPPAEGFVYAGLSAGTTLDEVVAAQAERLPEILEKVPVHAGEALFLPSGIVHALTPCAVVFEIEEPNEITWRLNDWGRGRPLHIEAARRGADPAARARKVELDEPFEVGPARVAVRPGPDRLEAVLAVLLTGEARAGGAVLPWGRAVRPDAPVEVAPGGAIAAVLP